MQARVVYPELESQEDLNRVQEYAEELDAFMSQECSWLPRLGFPTLTTRRCPVCRLGGDRPDGGHPLERPGRTQGARRLRPLHTPQIRQARSLREGRGRRGCGAGGLGLSRKEYCLVTESLGRDWSVYVTLAVQNDLVSRAIQLLHPYISCYD